MSADAQVSGCGPLRPPARFRFALGYAFAADPDGGPDLEHRLQGHAAACGLHLSQVLIDTPASQRLALDGLIADLVRRRTRHILVPTDADLGDDGTGWLVRRVLESEFQAVVHTFPQP